MKQYYFKSSVLMLAAVLTAGLVAAQDNFRYWYSDIVNGGNASNIYEVQLVDGEAHLTQIANVSYGAHLSFVDSDDVLYLINDDNGEYQTLDVTNPGDGLSSVTTLDNPTGSMVTSTVSPDNKILVGSGSTSDIYQLDGSSLTVFAEDNDISGGDIFFLGNDLYLAAKPQGKFYKVNPEADNDLKGYVQQTVTGASNGPDNSFLVSSRNNSAFVQYGLDEDGNATELGQFPAMVVDGEELTALTLDNGDMASGYKGPELIEEGCPNFSTFYASHGPGISGTDLFQVEFVNGGAQLAMFAELDYKTHIALDELTGELYTARENGNGFQVWDVNSGEEIRDVSFENSLNSITAAVFNQNDGLLYIGSSSSNKIYSVDPITGDYEVAFSGVPISGGDLVIFNGELYITSRNGQSTIYKVNGDNDVTNTGSIANKVNGSSLMEDGSILSAHYNTNAFQVTDESGNLITDIPVFFENESYELLNGDLASGCLGDGDPGQEECANYKLYYSHMPQPGGSGEIYGVTLNADGTTTLELETEIDYGAHIAVSSEGLLYSVNAGTGEFIVWDPTTNTVVDGPIQISDDGNDLSNIPAAVIAPDGTFYIGTGSSDKVYEVDRSTGEADFFANGDVNGGDLIVTNDGTLWLVNRSNSEFINLSGGDNFTVDVSDINGAAVLANGNIIVADGNGESLLKVINPDNGEIIGDFDTGLPLYNGDLAGICLADVPDPDITPGDCYGFEVLEYIEGVEMNGSDIQSNRNNPEEALGAPEDNDTENFVTLGYGGSLTLGFGGAVYNEEGADIQIVETSYGNNTCESYHEVADVEVTQDGENWYSVGSVCLDGMVDISDAEVELEYITQIRISNNDDESETFDGYDVDGVVALHNECFENDDEGDLNGNNPNEVTPTNKTVQEEDEPVQVNVYPNPFIAELKVDLGKNFDNVQYEIYSNSTRVIVGDLQKTGRGKYSIPNLSTRLAQAGVNTIAGQYIVRFIANGEVIGSKIIIDSNAR